ncbi:MAG: rhodanese-like domain-containing protein [Terriglobia bacterium]
MSLLHRLGSALILAILSSTLVWAADTAHPVTASDLITASQLNDELSAVKAGKIVLLQVGFHTMYKMGHIPGSQYAGAASNAEGLTALKKLVASLPRDREIVIYCGCCPWDKCPNIRPAFQTLKEMGFSNLKALDIPERLGDDWTAKGFPIVKGE